MKGPDVRSWHIADDLEGPLLCQQLILSGPGSPGALAAPANIPIG